MATKKWVTGSTGRGLALTQACIVDTKDSYLNGQPAETLCGQFLEEAWEVTTRFHTLPCIECISALHKQRE